MSHSPSISADEIRTELLKVYPTKVARKRSAQILVNQKDPETNGTAACGVRG